MYPEAKMIEPMKIWKLPDNKEYMLSEICESGEYFAQEKIDGYWYQFEKTDNHSYLFSRNISVTTGFLTEKGENVPHIIDALSVLPPNTILIGEIFYPNKTSKDVTTIMGCLPKTAIERQKNNLIHYYVHDIIYYDNVNLINAPAIDRYKILSKIWVKHNLNNYDFLHLAEIIDENIEEKVVEILSRGGEGAVLKKKTLPYYPGKRPAWSTIKIKKTDTVDLVCIGFCDATREYTGKELDTWQYWEERLEQSVDGEYNYSKNIGDYYNDYLHNPHIYHPITKGYYYGWKTAIRVGAYDDNGNLIEIGTVSSGLTDTDKERMSTNPEEYLNQVFCINCMEKDNKEHTLRHPHIVMRRDDKSAKDCKISEIFS